MVEARVAEEGSSGNSESGIVGSGRRLDIDRG
jgi:hypothetical protein